MHGGGVGERERRVAGRRRRAEFTECAPDFVTSVLVVEVEYGIQKDERGDLLADCSELRGDRMC